MRPRKEAVAYHEAGHAVVATVLNFEVVSVTVDFCGNGRTLLRKHYYVGAPVAFELLAGYCAQKKFSPGSVRNEQWMLDQVHAGMALGIATIKNPSSNLLKAWASFVTGTPVGIDIIEAAASEIVNSGARVDVMLKRALRETETIVDENWPTIREVSEALVKETTISGETVRTLCRSPLDESR